MFKIFMFKLFRGMIWNEQICMTMYCLCSLKKRATTLGHA